jgi:hypothetical protein
VAIQTSVSQPILPENLANDLRSMNAEMKIAFFLLGRVDEFGSDEIFGIPRLNQA